MLLNLYIRKPTCREREKISEEVRDKTKGMDVGVTTKKTVLKYTWKFDAFMVAIL